MLCVFSMERIQRRTNVFSASVYNTSTGSVSDRWYVKSRQKRFVSGNLFQKSSAKRFEKTCQSGTIFPFIKISATEKTWITIFVFKKDGGQDKAILSKINKCRVIFRPPESGPRRLRHHLFVVFLLSPTSVFIKRNTVAIKTRVWFSLYIVTFPAENVFFSNYK